MRASNSCSGVFHAKRLNRKWPRQNDSLVKAISQTIPPGSTVFDIGAGAGLYVEQLRRCGYNCFGVDGIDGIEQITEGRVIRIDLAHPVQWLPPARWAICIEVGEHIPREHEQQFLENLCGAATDGLFVTWATRAQAAGGVGHVNCRDRDEVIEILAPFGWRPDWGQIDKMYGVVRRPFRKKLLVLRR